MKILREILQRFAHLFCRWFINRRDIFLIEPYIQIGERQKEESESSLLLVWFSERPEQGFSAQFRYTTGDTWKDLLVQAETIDLNLSNRLTYSKFIAFLDNLESGEIFEYRILLSGISVFNAKARAPVNAHQSYRIAICGDIGDGGEKCRIISQAIFEQNPDMLVIPGDIVYSNGLVEEYLANFFPILNSSKSKATKGVPLLRSMPVTAPWGNHDIANPKQFDESPQFSVDRLGYLHFFIQPNNGPMVDRAYLATGKTGGKKLLEYLPDDIASRANFSFDYGNSHWLMLDGNNYMDWSLKKLRDWVENDLNKAQSKTWKFVAVHQPPFTSDSVYRYDQRMRELCDIFERYGVDIVFSGHVHFYERTYPLKFRKNEEQMGGSYLVPGQIKLFRHRIPADERSVFYIASGAGAKLPDEAHKPVDSAFTAFIEYRINSFTVMDIRGCSLRLVQLDEKGWEIDRLSISKPSMHKRAA